jgi:hypothetical protein
MPPPLPQLLQPPQSLQLLQQSQQSLRWKQFRSLSSQREPQPQPELQVSQQLLHVLHEPWQVSPQPQLPWPQFSHLCPQPLSQQLLHVLQVLQVLHVLHVLQVLQLLQQLSQQSRWNKPPNLLHQRCKQDSSQQQLSQQALHPPPQHDDATAPPVATGAT